MEKTEIDLDVSRMQIATGDVLLFEALNQYERSIGGEKVRTEGKNFVCIAIRHYSHYLILLDS
jgi:hypothetical protein